MKQVFRAGTPALLVGLVVFASLVEAASLMSCSLIRRTDSAYWYKEKVWSGTDPLSKPSPAPRAFTELVPSQFTFHQAVSFLFSRLDETNAIVKQVYPDGTAGAELPARVLHRTHDSVLVVWPFPLANEVRFALINTDAKKAVVSSMGAGMVALGVSASVADCK